MPQNDLLVSQKTTQRHFFSTLHPVIFAAATMVAFVMFRNSRFNFHCYTPCEATPAQKSARKWRCDLSRRLARKITKCKPASVNRQIHEHTHTRILKPFEDSEPTGLKVAVRTSRRQSSGAEWKSSWPSWAFRPNESYGFRVRKATLNRASALVTVCPWYQSQPTSEDMKLYITTGLTEGWPRPNQLPCGPASKRRGWPGAERARQPRSGPAALDPPPGPCATRSQSAHSAQLPCVHPALAGAIRSGADQKANRRGQSWDGCVDGARAERAHHWPLITVVYLSAPGLVDRCRTYVARPAARPPVALGANSSRWFTTLRPSFRGPRRKGAGKRGFRVQELSESSGGGRPGLSVLTPSLTVSVDVKQYWTMLTHWSQLAPNMSADIRGS